MTNDNFQIDIASTLRQTEKLKSQLLTSVANLYQSMTDGDVSSSQRGDIFAQMIMDTYLLAEMLGVSNNAVDTKTLNKIRLMLLDSESSDEIKNSLLSLSKHIDKNRNIR